MCYAGYLSLPLRSLVQEGTLIPMVSTLCAPQHCVLFKQSASAKPWCNPVPAAGPDTSPTTTTAPSPTHLLSSSALTSPSTGPHPLQLWIHPPRSAPEGAAALASHPSWPVSLLDGSLTNFLREGRPFEEKRTEGTEVEEGWDRPRELDKVLKHAALEGLNFVWLGYENGHMFRWHELMRCDLWRYSTLAHTLNRPLAPFLS